MGSTLQNSTPVPCCHGNATMNCLYMLISVNKLVCIISMGGGKLKTHGMGQETSLSSLSAPGRRGTAIYLAPCIFALTTMPE